jgi:hypothetical protein
VEDYRGKLQIFDNDLAHTSQAVLQNLLRVRGLRLSRFLSILLSGMRGVPPLVAMLELAVARATLACDLPIRDLGPITLARDLGHPTAPP